MRNGLDIIDEHIIIRETIGYDGIKNVDIADLPSVLSFLKIVHNYQKIKRLAKADRGKQTRPSIRK